jgi:formylglycine-generating enzyme required for sulfatase activity
LRRSFPLVPVVLLASVLATGPAAAQRCEGIEVATGLGERRCLKPGAGERFKDCADCPEMVVVPSGSFTMGSPPDEPERAADREDQVRVSIARPFAVGAFAVTRAEFSVFVAATNYKLDEGCYFWTGTTWEERADRSWRSPGYAQDDRHPVTCVDLHGHAVLVGRLDLDGAGQLQRHHHLRRRPQG